MARIVRLPRPRRPHRRRLTAISATGNNLTLAPASLTLGRSTLGIGLGLANGSLALTPSSMGLTAEISLNNASLTLGRSTLGIGLGLANGSLALNGSSIGILSTVALAPGTLTITPSIIGLVLPLTASSLTLTGSLMAAGAPITMAPASLSLTPSPLRIGHGLGSASLTFTGDTLGIIAGVLPIFPMPLKLSGAFMGVYPPSATTGLRIKQNDYNALTIATNKVYGTGFGDYGYGQGNLPLVLINTPDTAAQWQALAAAVTASVDHQGGALTNMPTYTQNARIFASDVNNMRINVDPIAPNRFSTGSGAMSTAFLLFTNTRASSWTTTIACTFNATWADEDHARFFFNSSGSINITGLEPTGSGNPPDIEWNAFLRTKMGQIAFSRATTTQTATSPVGGPFTIGYYQLTDSLQSIYSGMDTSGGAYNADTILIQAKRLNFAGVNGGNGNGVQFVMTLTNAELTISAGTAVNVGHTRASTYLTITPPTYALVSGF